MICYWVLYQFNNGLPKSQIVCIEDSCPIRDIPDILEQRVSSQLISSNSETCLQQASLEIVDFKLMFSA
ncbi:MAG: hypothetical protein Q9M92_00485 [Enterobacterales bacterium]|nr:hypothetical protein [Enterobacterales bacterium]